MRLHITLDDDLVGDLDRIVGARERSSFIAKAVRHAIDERDRAAALEAALGSIADSGHDWDTDPAEWVRAQRTDRTQRAG
jgi:Arc/MetJ family transcription regulator